MGILYVRPALRQWADPGLALAGSGSAPVLIDLYNSLVAFWALDEASGNRADGIGSNTLTDNNTVGSDTGLVYGTAASFIAANVEALSIAMPAALRPGSADFWIGAWIRPATSVSSFRSVVQARDGGAVADIDYICRLNAGKPEFLINISGTLYTAQVNSTVTLEAWHFLLGWRNGSTIYCQLNNAGTPASAAATSGSVAANSAIFWLGAYGASSPTSEAYNGRMGPVMVGTSHAPTEAERTALYNAGAGLTLSAMSTT